MLTQTEENYLKAIFKINEHSPEQVSTNAIANIVQTSAASVTDMIKKLSAKDLLHYEPYKGVRLSSQGAKIATELVRKHRLWETFLVSKLGFSWEDVHDIAEQLEHVQSDMLVDKLDKYLRFPKYDPHGDPIPNAEGRFTLREQSLLSRATVGASVILVGVKNHKKEFLKHLNKLNISLGCEIHILSKEEYDASLIVAIDQNDPITLSNQIASSLFIRTS